MKSMLQTKLPLFHLLFPKINGTRQRRDSNPRPPEFIQVQKKPQEHGVQQETYFFNLKSNSDLKSKKGHNLLKRVFPSSNVKLFITALSASLIPQECNQTKISSQEDKQGIKFRKEQ